MPVAHKHGVTGARVACHLSCSNPCGAARGGDERRSHILSGADSNTEPFDCPHGESAVDVLRSALAACTCVPALSCSTTQSTGTTSSITPSASLPSAWTTQQRNEALGTLIDLVAADMGLSGLRVGQGEPAEGFENATPRATVDDLLLYLTAERPSILAALQYRRRQRRPIPTPESEVTNTEPGVCVDAYALSEEDRALTALIRYAASAALANRHLQGGAQWGSPNEQPPASQMLHSCTALSLLHTACSSCRPLRTALGRTGASRPAVAAANAFTFWCSTGCMRLDQALGGGGFRSGWVTEVYGEAGSGKTQLVLQCLLQQAAIDVCNAAVASLLVSDEGFTSFVNKATVAGMWCTNSPAAKCRDFFDEDVVEAARCAVVYLVSEDVPASRLGPLAAAAVKRAVRALRLHPLLTQLPPWASKAVWDTVESTCTLTRVLSQLQIRHVASLAEVMQLLEPSSQPQPAPISRRTSLTPSVPKRVQQPPSTRLVDAVRTFSGCLGRAVVVLDSIAGAAVAGQCDLRGAPRDDAAVVAAGLRLRHVAITRNWCILVTNQVRAVPTAARQRQSGIAPIKRARSPTISSTTSVSAGARAVVPALGFSWASAPQCRVFLRKSLSQGLRQLVLRHAPSLPPAQVSYLITEDGIEDA
ncbi:hypothetical protein JKF63_00632 [Porcisia hertigi]|uniref:RecA-like N-terminal domain-containing protein n=1 Tax=Porcisia hertigi TaxID=2761500 RepID=A0A836GYN3_9TRYP|nr:hypothetical protein JKF63_00632 [Porcisia hertigi]